jgi:hypothetical protein
MLRHRAGYRAALGLGAVAAMALGGCGGQSANDKFVDKANKTCREGKVAVKDAGSDLAKLRTASRAYVSKLRAIRPPKDKEPTYHRFVTANESFVNEVLDAAAARDLRRLDKADSHQGDADAKSLGLDDCLG